MARFNYAVDYVAEHPDLEPGFTVSEADLDAFFETLPDFDASVDRDDFEGAERFVRFQLEGEIALQAWGEEGQFRQLMDHDPQLARALDVLSGVETPSELLEGIALEEPDVVAAPGS